MKFISHRGNIFKKDSAQENSPEYIVKALDAGYDVEIDVWVVNKIIYLGHDEPQHLIEAGFLLANQSKLWCHAKNGQAFNYLNDLGFNCFFHTDEDYVLTGSRRIWVYPGKKLFEGNVAVLPEITEYTDKDLSVCYAICSDNIDRYKRTFS
jgi:hypothetical protein